MKALIIFKSGAQISVDMDQITTTRDRLNPGHITQLEWVTPNDWTSKLHTVQVSEIVAIVAQREEPEIEE